MRRWWLGALVVVMGCRSQEPEKSAGVASPVAVKQAVTYGAAVTGATVALGDVVKSPSTYKGQAIVTEGTVSRVCQERGCWLALKDGASNAVVRMHGHTFFVPTTSSGKHARVRGTVMLMKDGRECDEMEVESAQLEIDATGVELD